MEEIVNFKQSILQNSFLSFFNLYITRTTEEQLLFVKNLKEINLDIFFYQVLKKTLF